MSARKERSSSRCWQHRWQQLVKKKLPFLVPLGPGITGIVSKLDGEKTRILRAHTLVSLREWLLFAAVSLFARGEEGKPHLPNHKTSQDKGAVSLLDSRQALMQYKDHMQTHMKHGSKTQ